MKGFVTEITGQKFGMLTAMTKTDRRTSNKGIIWEFACDCGNTTFSEAYPVKKGITVSCGCYGKEKRTESRTTHGCSGTAEYHVWKQIKARIFNKDNDQYPAYGGRGLTMSPEFVDNMSFFYEHLGPKPDNIEDYSVGRIDNDVGYVLGNIRWETRQIQSRNQRKRSNNSSGYTGVDFADKKGFLYVTAKCLNEGKTVCKCFSVNKYGLLPAFKLACCARDEMLSKLNSVGAGYSDKHGK